MCGAELVSFVHSLNGSRARSTSQQSHPHGKENRRRDTKYINIFMSCVFLCVNFRTNESFVIYSVIKILSLAESSECVRRSAFGGAVIGNSMSRSFALFHVIRLRSSRSPRSRRLCRAACVQPQLVRRSGSRLSATSSELNTPSRRRGERATQRAAEFFNESVYSAAIEKRAIFTEPMAAQAAARASEPVQFEALNFLIDHHLVQAH